MAISLNKELTSGLTASYWKIKEIRILSIQTIVHVALYKDSAARAALKEPVEIKEYAFIDGENPCTSIALEAESAYVLCYNKLKSLSEFSEAIDA